MRRRGHFKILSGMLAAVVCTVNLCMPMNASAKEEESVSIAGKNLRTTEQAEGEKALTTEVRLAGEGNVEGSNTSMPGGWAGMRITVGEKDIKVTELGRWYTSQSNATHNLMLVNVDGSLVTGGNATATAALGTPEGFVYGRLDNPVVLKKNTSYYLVGDYYGNRDKFYAGAASTTTGDASVDGIVILEGQNWSFYEAANVGWGPVDLKYEVVKDPVTPPEGGKDPVTPPEGGDKDPATPPEGGDKDPTTPPENPGNQEQPGGPLTLTSSVALAGLGNTPGSDVVMPGGWAGMRITVGAKDLKVTALGRWYTEGSATTHNFMIVNMDGSLVLDYGKARANATVGQAAGFVYGQVEDGVVLKKNTPYYIVADFAGADDKFYAGATSTTTGDASVDGIVILSGERWTFTEAANVGWGPVDLEYEILEDPVTPPEEEAKDPTIPPENPGNQEQPGAPVTFTSSVVLAGPGNVPGSDIVMPAGWAGMQITVGAKDLNVTALGRWYEEGCAPVHNFLIVNTDGSLVLDIGKAVANAGEGASEGFVYGEIQGGVVLKANTTYYIVSDFAGPEDKFYSAAESTHTDAASIDGIVILENGEWKYYQAANIGWGPLDLKYTEGAGNGNGGANLSGQIKKKPVAYTRRVQIAGPANTPGSEITMPGGWAGMRITVGSEDLEVTELGRWYTEGSALTHNFLIVNMDGSLVLDYGKAVAKATLGQEDGFLYGELKDSVVLKKNTSYYIVSDFAGPDDKFYVSSVSEVNGNAASLDGIAILEGENWKFHEAPGTGWGPVDFKYRSANSPKTGDTDELPIALPVACGAAIAVGIVYVGKRRKEEI